MKIRSFAAAVATLIAIQGNATEISTAEEFVTALAADPAGSYTLTQNIDLTGSGFTTLASFTGTLDGGGHILSGMGAQAFCTAFAGTVKSITLDGNVSSLPTSISKDAGGVFCDTCNGGKFLDCIICGYQVKHSKAESGSYIGLFAGTATDGTELTRCSTTDDCLVSQNGKAATYQGGFVGLVKIVNAQGVIATFQDCTNNATVSAAGAYNAVAGSGGFVAMTANTGSSDVPQIHFIRCVNNGSVTSTGQMSIGGFVGFQSGGGSSGSSQLCLYSQCVNNGAISSTSTSGNAGGFVGQGSKGAAATFCDCVNLGDVNSPTLPFAGGFVGAASPDGANGALSGSRPFEFVNCANYGAIAGVKVGGIQGVSQTASWTGPVLARYKNCANYGTLTASEASAEILGSQPNGKGGSSVTFDNCWAPTDSFHGECKHLDGETNMRTGDEALSGLNMVANATDGYMPWVVGASGHPELAMFSSVSPSTDIPVIFLNWDGTVLKKEFVASGEAATPPAENPEKPGSSFLGWDKAFDNIVAITCVNAIFGTQTRTITFESAGGSACDPITASIGANIVLPEPVREGWTFVCWAEEMALRMPGTMPDYDLALTAVWKKNEMPEAVKIKTLLWRVKMTSGDVVTETMKEISPYGSDFAAIIGLTAYATEQIRSNCPEGYDFTCCGTNSGSDGGALTLLWPTNKFEFAGRVDTSCGSFNRLFYASFRERGTDNYYIVIPFRYSHDTGIDAHVSSFVNLLSNVRAKYPTATILILTDYSDVVNATQYESLCGGTPQGAIDYFTDQTGARLIRGGDDLHLMLMKSAYEKMGLSVVGTETIENDTAADEVGYCTTFRLGKSRGLTLIFR